MKNLKICIKKYKVIISMLFFIFLSFLIFGLTVFHNNIWYDEAYQMVLNRYNYSEIIYFVSRDFSGPAYAIGLKLVTSIFGNDLWVGRLYSLGIFSVSFYLAMYPLRKLFSYKTSVIFCSLLLLIPVSFFLATEIRTYSLAFTCTLGASIYGLTFFKTQKVSDSIKYIIFSVLGLYSHNYAIIYIFFLANTLLLLSIFKRKNTKCILISNLIILFCFLPWIMILSNQAKELSNHFWIQKPNESMIQYTIAYIFGNYPLIWGIFIVTSIINIIVLYLRKKEELYYGLFFLITVAITIIFVIWYSFNKTPLFYPKYLATILGVFIVFLSVILSYIKKNYIIFILLLILIIPFFNRYKYERKIVKMEKTNNLVDFINKNLTKKTAFYHTGEFSLGVLEYYFPKSKHYVSQNTEIYVTEPKIFGDVKRISYQEKIDSDVDKVIVLNPEFYDNIYLKKQNFKVCDEMQIYIPYSNNYYEIVVFEKNENNFHNDFIFDFIT